MIPSVISSKQFSRQFKRHQLAGFTLPELLVASLITSLVLTAAGFGLVRILQASQKSTAEQERQSELNRALNFMADDIKEATSVEVASDPSYLLKLIKADSSEIVYYTGTSSSWRGRVVYRKEIAPTTMKAYALVDAIANVNPTCTGNGGDTDGNQGLKVFVQDNAYVKLCLVGELSDSRTLLLETQAFTRGS
ncbi:type II secretion system protein J [Acaryochloris sp. CCMEE 5410]|uniref:PulJ/GspJ family protein n=1 Tax=Acaryochloris sp. CCMEE 5410 TaxID=310037 RepID=UPI0002483DCF|nr:prepilin-type N-terminal cleavage/methylation domain-containing protein [Acaryochloris sp. CCMEE 5410]